MSDQMVKPGDVVDVRMKVLRVEYGGFGVVVEPEGTPEVGVNCETGHHIVRELDLDIPSVNGDGQFGPDHSQLAPHWSPEYRQALLEVVRAADLFLSTGNQDWTDNEDGSGWACYRAVLHAQELAHRVTT